MTLNNEKPPPHEKRRSHLSRIAGFLLVGGVGFLVDAAVFNALAYWAGRGPLFEQPLAAKIIAIAVATIVTYFGNAVLTYRDRSRPSGRRFLLYCLLNGAAILLQLGCLGFSRYVLQLADPISDNVAGTVVGQTVATVFRYVTYARWVFPESESTGDGVEPGSGR